MKQLSQIIIKDFPAKQIERELKDIRMKQDFTVSKVFLTFNKKEKQVESRDIVSCLMKKFDSLLRKHHSRQS